MITFIKNNWNKLVLLILLIFFGIIVTINTCKNSSINIEAIPVIKSDTVYIEPLTLNNVLGELYKQEVKYPMIVLRQVIVETMWLKCQNCSLDFNNLLGFGWTGKSYNSYKTWKESITDYKKWQDKYLKLSDKDYYNFLLRMKYATATNYIQELKAVDLKFLIE